MAIQYSTETLDPRFSDVILEELNPRFSRCNIEVSASEKPLAVGTVLSKGTDVVFAPYVASGTASAVLACDLPASKEKQQAVAIVGYAIVNPDALIFDEAITDKKTALGQLEVNGFILRNMAGEKPETEAEPSKNPETEIQPEKGNEGNPETPEEKSDANAQ